MAGNPHIENIANTNQLTIRLKPTNEELNAALNNCATDHKGLIVPQERIEPYESLNETKRAEYLSLKNINNEQNKLVASGNADTEEIESYERVIQFQFKHMPNLKNCLKKVKAILKEEFEKGALAYWSISLNTHALTHPGNLFIGGIPKNMSLNTLMETFDKFGTISSLKILFDNKNVGIGFLSFMLGSEAAECIRCMNGTKIRSDNGDEGTLFINYHIERKERERLFLSHESSDSSTSSLSVRNMRVNTHHRGKHNSPELNSWSTNNSSDDLTINNCVFIGNLPTDIQNEGEFIDDLTEAFPSVTVISYYFPYDHSLNQYKGYGFIKLQNNDQARRIIHEISTDCFEFCGNHIIANKASNKDNKTTSHFTLYTKTTETNPKTRNNYLEQTSPYAGGINTFPPSMNNYTFGYDLYPPIKRGSHNLPYIYGLPVPLEGQQESNIYVKHVPLDCSDKDLFNFYRPFGNIISCKIITVGGSSREDKSTNSSDEDLPFGISRGYGFVYFANPLDAAYAILSTDGYYLEGAIQKLSVSYAQKKKKDGQSLLDESLSNESSDQIDNSEKTNEKEKRNHSSAKFGQQQYNKKFMNALMNNFYHRNYVGKPSYNLVPSQAMGSPGMSSGMISSSRGNMGLMTPQLIPAAPIDMYSTNSQPRILPNANWFAYPIYPQCPVPLPMDNLV